MKELFSTGYEKFNEMLKRMFSIDGKIDKLVELFQGLDELVKIGILILALIIVYLGVFQLVKKIVFGLPKKLFFFAVFLGILYVVFTFLLK